VFDTCSIKALEDFKLLSEYLPRVDLKVGITKEAREEVKIKKVEDLIRRDYIHVLRPKNSAKHIADTRKIQRVMRTRKHLGEISSYVFVRNHSKTILISDDNFVKSLMTKFGIVPWFGFSFYLYSLFKRGELTLQNCCDIFKRIIERQKWGDKVIFSNIAGMMEIDPDFGKRLMNSIE
jgi:hypothetical protein